MRQTAWLNAAPQRPPEQDAAPQMTRLQRIRKQQKDEDFHPEMPPVETAQHLLGYLFEVGPSMPGGMSSVPITHQEIAAWCELTGITLGPWESRTLRRLSREYVGELNEATDPKRPAPWRGDMGEVDAAAVADSLRDSIRSLAKL